MPPYFHTLTLVLLTIFAGSLAAPTQSTDGRSGIVFLGMFNSPADVKDTRTHCERLRDYFDNSGKEHDIVGERPAFCDKVLNVVAGNSDPTLQEPIPPIRAAGITTDSRKRILVSEPGTRIVHIFDFLGRKYTRLDGNQEDRLAFPLGLAIDSDDNIYVTDVQRGTIAVFSAEGKFQKYIGDYKGERAFDQPTSIAVNTASGRIYVADTARHFLLIFDRDGKKLASIGKRGGGTGPGQFRLPTDVLLHNHQLFVLDKKNRRIQILDLEGRYKAELRTESVGSDAPRGMAIDSKGRIYILMNAGIIQVLNERGEPLYQFGHYGTEAGEFKDPTGIFIDSADRLYVSDTGNQRIQIFKITNNALRANTE